MVCAPGSWAPGVATGHAACPGRAGNRARDSSPTPRTSVSHSMPEWVDSYSKKPGCSSSSPRTRVPTATKSCAGAVASCHSPDRRISCRRSVRRSPSRRPPAPGPARRPAAASSGDDRERGCRARPGNAGSDSRRAASAWCARSFGRDRPTAGSSAPPAWRRVGRARPSRYHGSPGARTPGERRCWGYTGRRGRRRRAGPGGPGSARRSADRAASRAPVRPTVTRTRWFSIRRAVARTAWRGRGDAARPLATGRRTRRRPASGPGSKATVTVSVRSRSG